MSLSPFRRRWLERLLELNGYHNPLPAPLPGDWVAADANFAPGCCFIAYDPAGRAERGPAGAPMGTTAEAPTRVMVRTPATPGAGEPAEPERYRIALSLGHVASAYAEEAGALPPDDRPLPKGAVAAWRVVGDAAAQALIRRLFELSRALPDAPVERYRASLRSMPTATEVAREVMQRIGQDVFRDALMAFWSGRCAVTGLDQPELLRASHMQPWAACATDAERLDPHNGLLLAAHWDAAFDRGLVTFTNAGETLASPKLTPAARHLLGLDGSDPPRLTFRPAHYPYLAHHREQVWRS